MMRFALIVPTLNEAARLNRTLASARTAFGDSAEFIVSDGGSTDGTCVIAEAFGARVVTGGAGRGDQLHRGFCAANSDACVFLHADTLLPTDARAVIDAAFQSADVAGGAFSIEFHDAPNGSRILHLLQRAINLRARLFRSATGDQVIFVRRSVLEELGGVPRVPLFEDVLLCRAIKQKGRFVILPTRVATSARLWQRIGPLRGILLHWAFRALHALGASPVFLARHYPAPR
jgi:rSAM/selenodomain-associated transferase 2